VGGWAICSLYYMEYKQDSKTKSGDMSRPHARKTHHPSPSGTVWTRSLHSVHTIHLGRVILDGQGNLRVLVFNCMHHTQHDHPWLLLSVSCTGHPKTIAEPPSTARQNPPIITQSVLSCLFHKPFKNDCWDHIHNIDNVPCSRVPFNPCCLCFLSQAIHNMDDVPCSRLPFNPCCLCFSHRPSTIWTTSHAMATIQSVLPLFFSHRPSKPTEPPLQCFATKLFLWPSWQS